MKRLLFFLCGLALPLVAQSQIPANEIAVVDVETNGPTSTLSWFGKQDYAYFLLSSDNLEDWVYINNIFVGQDAVIDSFSFSSPPAPDPSSGRIAGTGVFWKLHYLNEPIIGNPADMDPDGDRIGAQSELDTLTDPFSSYDTDNDGLPDDWEWFYSFSYSLNLYSDNDGDFILDGQEFEYNLDASAQDPVPALSFSPSSSPTYTGSIDITIESEPYIGYIFYTLDGSTPTTESRRFHPSSPIATGDNGRLTIKARIILPDGRQGSVISATYKVRPTTNPTTVYYGYNKFTGNPVTTTNINLLAPAINQGYSHGYLILGQGWVDGGSFVPDLSQASVIIYYGLATAVVGGQEIRYYGYSTNALSFWTNIGGYPRNYLTIGKGWILTEASIKADTMQPSSQIWAIQKRFKTPYIAGPVFYEFKWILTTDPFWDSDDDNAPDAYSRYSVGEGWLSSQEDLIPDTSQSSSAVYYGVVQGPGSLGKVYTDILATFPGQDYVQLSDGWPSGLYSMLPDKEKSSENIFYGEKDYVSAVVNERVLSRYRVHINPAAHLPTYKDVAIGKAWTTSIETYDRDFSQVPQSVYQGTEDVGPGVLPHIEFHAYSQAELQEANPTNLGEGWIENNFFVPYVDDNDGLTFAEEIAYGTNPWSNDSDGDGVLDGIEVHTNNTDPTKWDSDYDGEGDGVDINPNDPTNGLDDLVPPDKPIIEVDHVTLSKSKPGYSPFQTDTPPSNRYLRKEYSQSFSKTGSGQGPESSLSVSVTSTINPLTGEESVSSTGNTSTRNGSMSATSPTQRSGSSEISSYDDPPNKKPDEAEGDLSSTETLSELYTTQAFVTDTLANQEPWPDTYVSRNATAYYDIAADELSVSYRKIKYRFKWDDIPENNQEKTINWIVLYTPDDPEEPLEAESFSWTGEALEHEADPIVPDREGTWEVLVLEMTPNPIPANGVVRAKLDLSPILSGLDTLNNMPDATISFDGQTVVNLHQDDYDSSVFYFEPIADGEDDPKDVTLSGFLVNGEEHPDIKLKKFARYTKDQVEGVKQFSAAIGVSIEEAKSKTDKKVDDENLTEREAADYFSFLMESQAPLGIYLMGEFLGDDISDDAAAALGVLENDNVQRSVDVFADLGFDPESGSSGGGVGQIFINVVAIEETASETGSSANFRITRTDGYNDPLIVHFTLSGTAINGTDYTQVPLTATIAPFTASVDVEIDAINDGLTEGTEDVDIDVQENPAYALGLSPSATIEITD